MTENTFDAKNFEGINTNVAKACQTKSVGGAGPMTFVGEGVTGLKFTILMWLLYRLF